MKPSDMSGKAGIVTAAGFYLGRATALSLARAGADVCLIDTNQEGVEETAAMVRKLGRRAHVVDMDIGERQSCIDAVEEAIEAFGRLDALCNVANVFRPSHSTKTPQDDWERTIAINLSAPFYLIQAALPHLLKTEGAAVSVLSCVAVLAHPYTAAYTASKAGLAQLTKSLALEFIGDKVRINSVSFGGAALSPTSAATFPEDLDPKLFQKFSTVRPRIEVEEVAEVIAFMVSDAARGFHGTCVTLDNGVSLG